MCILLTDNCKKMTKTVSARLIGGDTSSSTVYTDGIRQSVRGYSQKLLDFEGGSTNAEALVKPSEPGNFITLNVNNVTNTSLVIYSVRNYAKEIRFGGKSP